MSSMKVRIAIDRTYTLGEKVAVLLIVLSPILQHYKGIFVYGGLLALILAMPYALIKLAGSRRVTSEVLAITVSILPYFLFQVMDHGTNFSEIGHVVLIFLYMLAFCSGAMHTKLFVKTAVMISCIASALIILQYICYYIFGFHLQLVPTSMLLNNANQWVRLAQTGRIGITGRVSALYRPSAFFLEPAHMFIYLFPPLFYELLHPDVASRGIKRAILISVGIILSTSGMGIVVTAAVWLLYFSKRGNRDNRLSVLKLLRPRNVLTIGIIVAILYILYSRVDFFQNSLLRVLSSEGRESAISGRTTLGNAFISQMKGSQLIFGISDSYANDIEFHMSGFNGSIYRYGIIGTILSYVFYVKSVFELRNQQFWMAIVIIAISFFSAHTHAAFYMLYFLIFLIDGYCTKIEVTKTRSQRHLDVVAG